jgi:hypothetical protein
MSFEVTSLNRDALDGAATRKEISVCFFGAPDAPKMDLLLYFPNDAPTPPPVIVSLNFAGNHAIHPDPGIALPTQWKKNETGIVGVRATEESRGTDPRKWPVEKILARGYALATACYGDIEPDFSEGSRYGVRSRYTETWGAIGAWAWGLSRALDYLETDSALDAGRVAVLGHSRLGKAALWAGAQDERFALVISNESGALGAKLSRRWFGETVAEITGRFPYWFCDQFRRYVGREAELPVDQHELIAQMAPRPVYIASAEEDKWADPRGEFLAAKHAEPVYRLYGKCGLNVDQMPPVHQPVGDNIGYHIRAGAHGVKEYDWEQFLNFADKHFQGRSGSV